MKKVLGLLIMGLLIAGAVQAASPDEDDAGAFRIGAKYLGIWAKADSANAGVATCSTTLNVGGMVADIGYAIIPNLVIEGEFGLMNYGAQINSNTITYMIPVIGVGLTYQLPAIADGKFIITVGGEFTYLQYHMEVAAGTIDYVTMIIGGKCGVNYYLSHDSSLYGAVGVGVDYMTAYQTGVAAQDRGSGLAITYQFGIKTYLN